MNEELATGLIFAPEDDRNALYGAFEEVGSDYPKEFALDRLDFYRNQQQQPSCVVQTVARIMDYYNRHESDSSRVSARYGFAYCKALDGYPSLEGTFVKTAFEVATNLGLANNLVWADDPTVSYAEYIKKPSSAADKSAAPFRFSGYVFMVKPEEIKDYILKYRVPVSLGLNANNTSWGWSAVNQANQWTMPEPTGSRLGHLMACVGWNERGWIIENSWGQYWGDTARATVPYGHSGLQGTMTGGYDLPNNWQIINEEYKKMVNKENMNAVLYVFTGNTENWAEAQILADALNTGNQAKVTEVLSKYKATSAADEKIKKIETVIHG